jgi:hypothetical protein
MANKALKVKPGLLVPTVGKVQLVKQVSMVRQAKQDLLGHLEKTVPLVPWELWDQQENKEFKGQLAHLA